MQHKLARIISLGFLVALSSCSGGGSSTHSGSESANNGCDGTCAHQHLSIAEVKQIITQADSGAKLLGVAGTIAVLDRVGNVLAVYAMDGAPQITKINGQIGAQGGLEGLLVPSTLAAISKAGTGAYLSSQGNAFSTRTASQIIQEHFNPGEMNQPGGPLFGVQFSQLICSDLTVLNPLFANGISSGQKATSSGGIGPRSLPLGLSADPGGIPLYKNGDVVGGVGVEFDGVYTLDVNIMDVDSDPEEAVALYASIGFEAPSERTGDKIFAGGKTLRYTDLTYDDLEPLPSALPEINLSKLQTVFLFSDGTIRDGVTYGAAESGVVLTSRAGLDAAVLVNGGGAVRFPTQAGSLITASEVDAILDSALLTAHRARAAIRTPLDTPAEVSIFVIDTDGNVLGMVRSADAPIFGLDVALQKARTVAFISSSDAGTMLNSVRSRNSVGSFEDYAANVQNFISVPLNGTFAFANRSIGNLARPFFIDGIDGNPNGPFSLPFPGSPGSSRSWSPFNDGLQLDLVFQRIAAPLGIPKNPPSVIPDSCTDSVLGSRLRNGIQIFPGAVPLYRGTTLIGAIGISGDGVDQDDLVAFYGASRQGLDAAGHVDIGDITYGFNAPKEIRADNLEGPFSNSHLRYVNCPEGPWRESKEQNVCDGL